MSQREIPPVPGLKRSSWTRAKAVMYRRLGWLWQPTLYAGLVFGFLAGSALPNSQMAPIGIAFYAAVRGAGFGPVAALVPGLAIEAGSLTVLYFDPNSTQVVWIGLALVVVHLLSSLLRIGARAPSPLGASLMAAVAVLVPGMMARPAIAPPMLLLVAGLTGLLALVFTLGILDITSGSLFRGAVPDSPVPAIVIITALLCGLGAFPGPSLYLWQQIAAGLMVLMFAYMGGPALGAAAAAMAGVSFLLTAVDYEAWAMTAANGTIAGQSMAYVVAGLIAGTFRDLRKIGVALGFLLGLVAYYLTFSLPGRTTIEIVGAVSALLFWIIPRRWMARMPMALLAPGFARTRAAERAGVPTEAMTLPDRLRALSRVLREVSRAFLHVATVEAPPEEQADRAFDQVAERVCHACALYQQCWDRESHRTHQTLTDLWEKTEAEGGLVTQPPPTSLEFCIYPTEVASTLNYLQDLHRSHNHWERLLAEGRVVAGDYVKNAARILEQFAEEAGGGEADLPPVMAASSGIARMPKRGSHISGDSYVSQKLSENRYLMALSDGMGVGTSAAADSKQCVQLLTEVLGAGFTPELGIKTINSVFLMRSSEEAFVTVDLSLLDLGTGRAEFVKIGAAPSFIKRGPDVTVVKQSSVPVGIINQVTVEPEYRQVHPGDLIVMVTDGIWDVCKENIDKERWLIEHLSRETASDPEQVAESLLAKALVLMPDVGDDMTVLVTRIEAQGAGEVSQEFKLPEGLDWAPVRRAPHNTGKLPERTER